MAKYLRPRRGKQATAVSQNIILKRGEVFFEVPTGGVGTGAGKIKMGDGTTAYDSLPYFLQQTTVDVASSVVAFTESSTTANATLLNEIASGATVKVLIGAIKKLLRNLDSSVTSLNNDLDSLSTSFQDGCNSIYDACVAKGVTPTTNSPDAIVTAIEQIYQTVLDRSVYTSWCMTAGLDREYEEITDITDADFQVLFQNTDAINFMINNSTLRTVILNNTTIALKAVTYSDTLTAMKANSAWRSAIASNTDLKTALRTCSVIQSKTISLSARGTSQGSYSSSKNSTVTLDYTNALLIAVDLKGVCRFDESATSSSMSVTAKVNDTQVASKSSDYGTHTSINISSITYPTFTDVVTSLYCYYKAGSYNTELSSSSGSAVFYYL